MTALTTHHQFSKIKLESEILIYHSPKEHPIELVGQGTLPLTTHLISDILEINWYNNKIGATFKTGILYEGWGKKKEKFFHPFSLELIAIHFVPEKLSQAVLNFKDFTVIEKTIKEPEKEIDADMIFDCRGKNNRDKKEYNNLINPLNSVLISKENKIDKDLIYTRAVATPNGWTFIIPNEDSISYGYLYNKNITSTKEATKDFLERFNLSKIDKKIKFENYMVKNIFKGERTVLQGNKCGFLEPLEANSIPFYMDLSMYALDFLFNPKNSKDLINEKVQKEMKKIETFVLWHYQFGSKYNSPFWEYAKSLPFKPDREFLRILERKILNANYNQWEGYAFKYWLDGVGL
jgi:tryptophan halogenase